MPGASTALALTMFGGGVATAGQLFVAKLIVGLGASILVSSVSRALTPKPKAPSVQAAEQLVTVREPAATRRVIYGQRRVGGVITFMETNNNNADVHVLITLCGHSVAQVGDVYFDGELVPRSGTSVTGKYAGIAEIHTGDGTTAGDTALLSQLQANFPSKWTADHKQAGCAKLLVRLRWTDPKLNGRVPNITVDVQGKNDIYDPRSASTGYTANLALCIRDYLSDGFFGLGAAAAELPDTDWIAEANIADQVVALAAGGSEARYECNGIIDTAAQPRKILEDMLSAGGGRLTYSGGGWRLFLAAWRSPVVTLTEADLRPGTIRVQPRLSRRDLANGIKGINIDAASNWQPDGYPAVTNATYLAEDGGEEIWRELDTPFTTSDSASQRLAKIELERIRQQISVALPCKLRAFRLGVADTVRLTLAKYGWTAKEFEVVEWRFAVYDDDQGAPAPGIDLLLRETASAVFDWNSGEETVVDPAPDSNLPSPADIGLPTALSLASGDSELFIGGDGTVGSRIKATWTAPADAFVTRYDVRFKRSVEAEWTAAGSPSATTVYLGPVQDGAAYDVEVRSVNMHGNESDWVGYYGYTVIGKSAPPSSADQFNIARLADGTRRFTWTITDPPADVRVGGTVRVHWYLGTTSTLSAMTVLEKLPAHMSSWETNDLAAGDYTFALTVVDSSGNESTPLFIAASLGDPRLRNVLLQQLDYADGWPGTKTGCFIGPQGYLLPLSTSTINDLPATISGLAASINTIGTNTDPIVYTTATIDLGAGLAFTPLVSADVDGAATFSMQTGTAADGAPVGSFVALAPVTARYIKIKVSVAGSAAVIRNLVVLLDGETALESFEDIAVATESAAWFSRIAAGHFRVATEGDIETITSATIRAIQNVGAGWTWELISKAATVGTATAAEFKTYNSSGVLADATVDVELKGTKKVV